MNLGKDEQIDSKTLPTDLARPAGKLKYCLRFAIPPTPAHNGGCVSLFQRASLKNQTVWDSACLRARYLSCVGSVLGLGRAKTTIGSFGVSDRSAKQRLVVVLYFSDFRVGFFCNFGWLQRLPVNCNVCQWIETFVSELWTYKSLIRELSLIYIPEGT